MRRHADFRTENASAQASTPCDRPKGGDRRLREPTKSERLSIRVRGFSPHFLLPLGSCEHAGSHLHCRGLEVEGEGLRAAFIANVVRKKSQSRPDWRSAVETSSARACDGCPGEAPSHAGQQSSVSGDDAFQSRFLVERTENADATRRPLSTPSTIRSGSRGIVNARRIVAKRPLGTNWASSGGA